MENQNFRKVKFEFKECLVGQSVNCLAYAYMHNLPVFGLSHYKPLEFNYLPHDLDMSSLMIENEVKILKKLDNEEVKVGMDEIKLWHILCSKLSYSGLLPCFGMYDKINVVSNEVLKININNKNVIVESESFIFFDIIDDLLYEVNDYININKNSNIAIDYHLSSHETWPVFKELFFYQSDRVPGNHKNKKDVCAKSILSKEQISNFEYSETSVRFKVDNFLKEKMGKKVEMSLCKREANPLIESIFQLDEILNYDVELNNLKRMLYKHYIYSPCDIK